MMAAANICDDWRSRAHIRVNNSGLSPPRTSPKHAKSTSQASQGHLLFLALSLKNRICHIIGKCCKWNRGLKVRRVTPRLN